MPKIAYIDKRLGDVALGIIKQANTIITRLQDSGYSISLRQLYYQFVAQDLFPAKWADPTTGSTNNEKSYNKLGDIISDARMCGLIDWESIEDRGRFLRQRGEWSSPSSILDAISEQFRIDLWVGQPVRPEVWIEKDALVGSISTTCETNGIAYFSGRGYPSMTSLWDASQRFLRNAKAKQGSLILHFGDHDPSGIDMTRDISDRIKTFLGPFSSHFHITRLALNMDQINQYSPPPNPAKTTDSRFSAYRDLYGDESWELDALDPAVLNTLITSALPPLRSNSVAWTERLRLEAEHRRTLSAISVNYDDVVQTLEDAGHLDEPQEDGDADKEDKEDNDE